MSEIKSQTKAGPLWSFYLLIALFAILFHYAYGACATWKASNPPRPEHAKHISQAEALKAGPLDVSFCPELPQDLNFGDSLEVVIAKMGRDPDKKHKASNGAILCSFYEAAKEKPFNLGKLPDAYRFADSLVMYVFKNDHLASVLFGQEISYADSSFDVSGPKEAAGDFSRFFAKLYGAPRIFTLEKLPPDYKEFRAMSWEVRNNALVMMPLQYYDNEHAMMIVLLCPLNASGHYQFKDYIPHNDLM